MVGNQARLQHLCLTEFWPNYLFLKDKLLVYNDMGLVGEDSNHGIRRLFAHRQVVHYLQSGLSREQALVRLSNDLGHGDGRGRWVENNYLRGGEV